MNAWQRFWQRRSRKARRQFRRRIAAARFRRLVSEQLEPRVVLAAPVAISDAYAPVEDSTLAVAAPGVLANDSDTDGDLLSAVLAQPPTHGLVTLAPSGSFSYFPSLDYNGTDSFTYRASDGSTSSNLATVTLNVRPVNDAPSFNLSQTSITKLDTVGSQLINGLATGMQRGGGPDEATQTLTLALIGNTNPGLFSSPPIIDANGTLSYTVAPNVEGMAIITVELHDSGGTAAGGMDAATKTFSINIQHPHRWHNSMPPYQGPVTGGMEVLFEDAAHSITPTDVLLIMNYLSSSLPKNVPANAPLGNGTTVPFYDVDGDDVVTPTDALLIINILSAGLGGPLDTTPVTGELVAYADFYDVSRYGNYPICDSVLRIDSANGVLRNDRGANGPTLTAVLVAPPQFGAFTLAPTGAFTYSPAQDVGVDSFVYRASDGASTSFDAVVTIFTRNPLAFGGDSYVGTEDVPQTVAAPGVLVNDLTQGLIPSDATAILSQAPAHGSLTLAPSGGFTYSPDHDFNGDDVFRYRWTNGTYTSCSDTPARFYVLPVNDAPTFTTGPNQHVTDESGPRVVSTWAKNISPGPPDEAGQTVAFSIVGNTNPGIFSVPIAIDPAGTLSFAPRPNTEGTAVVTVQLQDSGGTAEGGIDFSTQSFQIAVTKPHRWHNAIPGLAADVDGDGLIKPNDALLLLNRIQPDRWPDIIRDDVPPTAPIANGTTFPFYDANADNRVDERDAFLVIRTLEPANHAPSVFGQKFSITEDTAFGLSSPGVLAIDFDIEEQPLTSILESPPAHGTLALLASGGFTYAPTHDFSGLDSFTYRASDGTTTSNLATVTLDVVPVNDRPTILALPHTHANDDSGQQSVALGSQISTGPPDEAEQTATLTITNVSNPAIFSGPVIIVGGTTLRFTPRPNSEGSAVVTVQLQDSGGTANGGHDSSTQQFQITVDKQHRWHNGSPPYSPVNRGAADVDGNLNLDSTDVLLIINYLNSGLPTKIAATAPIADGITRPFYDVDGDDIVTSTDALLIVNLLNSGQGGPFAKLTGGEGEGVLPKAADIQPALADVIELMAYDAAVQETRRRNKLVL